MPGFEITDINLKLFQNRHMDQLSLILFDLLIAVALLAIKLHTLCWLTSSDFQS